jgi:hypothetical protein
MVEYITDNNSSYHSHGKPLTVMVEYVTDNNSSYHSHGKPLTVMVEYVTDSARFTIMLRCA